MNTCKNCEHAIFDQLWGEYKCGLKYRSCSKNERKNGCDSWKEKKNDSTLSRS